MRLAFISSLFLALSAHSVSALALNACDRVTHVSHGGVDNHVDLGGGKVMWREWWFQEGVYIDLWVADCKTGRSYEARVREERITRDRPEFDRVERAAKVVMKHMDGASAFFTLERLKDDLRLISEDAVIAANDTEFCACQAAYPDLRGDKAAYEATQ